MSKNKGLGRGFESLIPAQVESEFDPVPEDSENIVELALTDIDPNPHQPREEFDAKELAALAASIAEHGVLQPIVVRRLGERYELIAGERRVRAVRELDWQTVPAVVRSFDEQQSLELALIENIQREQLNPVETAAAYRKLLDQFGLDAQSLARRVGRDMSTIKNTLRLLNLPTSAKQALASGRISEGHARAILSVRSSEQQEDLLQSIVNHGWTVRRAEEYARDVRAQKAAPGQLTTETEDTEQLALELGTKVQLQRRARGGRILIHYQDEDELEQLIRRLQNNSKIG